MEGSNYTSHFPLTLARKSSQRKTVRADQVLSEGEKGKKRRKSSQRALCVVLLESVFCLTLAKVF